MTTLIQTHGGDRCDARCYDARGPDCSCVCGGRNHGKGLQAALEQTLESFEEIREDKIGLEPRLSPRLRVILREKEGV